MRRILLMPAVVLAAACGSEWHMPGENITMPSSISVGPQTGQRPGETSQSDSRNRNQERSTTIPVLAHFMSWATVPGGWPTASVTPLRRDNPDGGYDSTNPDIIRQQNSEMQSNGILPMVSWWAKDTYAGDKFLDLFLSVPGPQIGILYEAVGPGRMQVKGAGDFVRLANRFGPPVDAYQPLSVSRMAVMDAAGTNGVDMGDPVNQRIFIEDMAHLQEKYFSGPHADRFFRIDGRPVVFVWISRAFYGPFEQVVAQARQRASFYLVGSDFITPWHASPGDETVIRGMDAISSYGFYDSTRYGIDMPPDFITDFGKAADDAAQWLAKNSPHTKIILPLGFAYDDTRIPGRRGIVFRSSYEIARSYAEKARAKIVDPCGDSRFLALAYITSYNEHYEGTAIEPTVEYQNNYLRIIRDTFLSVPPQERDRSACEDGRDGRSQRRQNLR